MPSPSNDVPSIFQRGPDEVQGPTGMPNQSASAAPSEITLPGVREFCDKFRIADHFGLMLDAQLQKRYKTYEGDLETLDEALSDSRSPAALLMTKIKEMQQGSFIGMPANHKHIVALQVKFSLDKSAMNRMTEALVNMG